MAVTRADKVAELQTLETAFQGSQTAVIVDYKADGDVSTSVKVAATWKAATSIISVGLG